MEADFNFNKNILEIYLMKCAERGGNTPKEKYGRRKENKSIMHAVKKRLLYNMVHLQRQPAILYNNDTKSCYERIVHSVAIMLIKRLGISAQPMECMLGKLQDLEHHTITAYGNLE